MKKSDMNRGLLWDIPLALVLLTRLPLPKLPPAVFVRQAHAAWAFPVVGLVVGLIAVMGVKLALIAGLPPALAAGIYLVVLIPLTGAMHEDGLADTADGLWGGFDAERRLAIMKDSQIGTYGVLALLMSQLLRWGAVWALIESAPIGWLLAAPVLSRACMPPVMALLPNARGRGLSHSVGAPNALTVMIGLALAGIICGSLLGTHLVPAALLAGLAVAALGLIARAKIGGQTGDILGAAQQVSELVILLTLCARVS